MNEYIAQLERQLRETREGAIAQLRELAARLLEQAGHLASLEGATGAAGAHVIEFAKVTATLVRLRERTHALRNLKARAAS